MKTILFIIQIHFYRPEGMIESEELSVFNTINQIYLETIRTRVSLEKPVTSGTCWNEQQHNIIEFQRALQG